MLPSLVVLALSHMAVPVTIDGLVKQRAKYHGRLVRVEVTLRNVMRHDRWWSVAEAPGTRGVSVSGPAAQDANNGDRLLATGVFTHDPKLWNAHAVDVLAVGRKARPARKLTAAEEQAQAAAKALAGAWNGVEYLVPNRFVQRLKDTAMTIGKGRMTLAAEGKAILSGTVVIDADYRILNVAVTEGAWKGKTIRGDYSLTKGVLYWSATFPGGVRTERRFTQGPVGKE